MFKEHRSADAIAICMLLFKWYIYHQHCVLRFESSPVCSRIAQLEEQQFRKGRGFDSRSCESG